MLDNLTPPPSILTLGNAKPAGLADDHDILEFLAAELSAGRPAVLATIVGLAGGFSRPLGAQIAIAGDKRFLGGISGGCLETAVAAEATAAIEARASRLVRYGEGSPYLDIRLPCGGSVDLFVDVLSNEAPIAPALQAIRDRKRFAFEFNPQQTKSTLQLTEFDASAGPARFVRPVKPRLRLVLAGRGWEVVALARQAAAFGVEVLVASQEAATLSYCDQVAHQAIALTTRTTGLPFAVDEDTAVVCLFHEHEWEVPILRDALHSGAFYIGALGSRQAHAARVEALRASGVEPALIDRVRGPIGLFASREPATIALATLSEILMQRENAP